MLRTKTFALFAFAVFLCSAAVMAGEEQDADNGKTTLRTIVVNGVTTAAKGITAGAKTVYVYGLDRGACDGSRAGLNALSDGADKAVHTTPAEYGKLTFRGGTFVYDETLKTPGRAWRATKWTLGHIW